MKVYSAHQPIIDYRVFCTGDEKLDTLSDTSLDASLDASLAGAGLVDVTTADTMRVEVGSAVVRQPLRSLHDRQLETKYGALTIKSVDKLQQKSKVLDMFKHCENFSECRMVIP